MKTLYLKIPRIEELWFKKEINEDQKTMEYNAGYEIFSPRYNYKKGTIKFPKKDWAGWHERYIGKEPKRYYAYVVRKEDDKFVGEVCFHFDEIKNTHLIGVVIKNRERGKGYATAALKLLIAKAEELGVKELVNSIPDYREAAIRSHKKAGFIESNKKEYSVRFGKEESNTVLVKKIK